MWEIAAPLSLYASKSLLSCSPVPLKCLQLPLCIPSHALLFIFQCFLLLQLCPDPFPAHLPISPPLSCSSSCLPHPASANLPVSPTPLLRIFLSPHPLLPHNRSPQSPFSCPLTPSCPSYSYPLQRRMIKLNQNRKNQNQVIRKFQRILTPHITARLAFFYFDDFLIPSKADLLRKV